MIRLQNLLLPDPDVCDQTEMYYRAETPCISCSAEKLILAENQTLSFDTYFNSFSIAKWREYTGLESVTLALRFEGTAVIHLLCLSHENGQVMRKELFSGSFAAEKSSQVILPYPQGHYDGLLSFTVQAESGPVFFYGGSYETEREETELTTVDLGINICTFRRETYIAHNLDVLNRAFLKNPQSDLSSHLKVYISDNGQTLDIPALSSDRIQIVKNKNLGGTGGFTRNMLEILHDESFRATHTLLMDDDIVIEPEAVFRTYMILRCLKKEYLDAFIGGAMLRLDQKNIQVESGACWDGNNPAPVYENLDLNRLEDAVKNELPAEREYNAWWYCCIPMKAVREDNLPLPIFIRGDDLEYGLRNIRKLILLNGICVWHEPFENKYSSSLNYYILRNLYYVNALHRPKYGTLQALKKMWRLTGREILYFRYENVDLILRGVSDFLKGPVFLRETDAEALHKELLTCGYKSVPCEQLGIQVSKEEYRRSLAELETAHGSLLQKLSLNGIFLPAVRDNVVSMSLCKPPNFYRVKTAVQYDPYADRCFVTKKSIPDTFRCFGRIIGMSFRMAAGYPRAVSAFRKEVPLLTSEPFWERYLGLKTYDTDE